RRAGALPDLRLVFNGGERLPEALAGDWLRWFPATCIANAYGMTESAIYGTNFVVRASDSVPAEAPVEAPAEAPVVLPVEAPVVLPAEAPVDAPVALPVVLIGRPIANERAYVLDADGDPCPPLCLGEIYLAGDSLSRGYQGRPELTAERFLPDPFGPPGARMYRTGDLGRRLPDGQLTCVGRADRQVKVRGARVELGEVEAALARHPAIRQAAVLARRAGDDHRLTAYYTVRATDPGARELHAFLLCTLPAYMVPSSFVALAELPLTVNGKVDRARLECAPPAQD
ncbi:MAG TPA: AMP-binding protein, partial [Kofleriaceae bacterium]|nr:AMP-binding protein [Kofleriaceae bacterium]